MSDKPEDQSVSAEADPYLIPLCVSPKFLG